MKDELDQCLDSLRHECTGAECEFCQWRQRHPNELGREKLLGCEADDLTTNFALSTQQMVDFVDRFHDFPAMDASVEKLLGEAEEAGSVPTTVVQSLTLCMNLPPLAAVPCPIVSCKADVQPSTSGRVYGSPKSEKAVSRAITSGIPVKTKLQTDWTVRVGQAPKVGFC